jgi:hypothetical protein
VIHFERYICDVVLCRDGDTVSKFSTGAELVILSDVSMCSLYVYLCVSVRVSDRSFIFRIGVYGSVQGRC